MILLGQNRSLPPLRHRAIVDIERHINGDVYVHVQDAIACETLLVHTEYVADHNGDELRTYNAALEIAGVTVDDHVNGVKV